MHIPYELLAWMAALGAIGGLVNCALSGEFQLPHVDQKAKVWRPGWVGNVLVGAVAAVVVWGIYSPAGSFDLAGSGSIEIRVTLAQLLSSLVVGLSGGRILSLETQKMIQRSEMEKEKDAKVNVVQILRDDLSNMEEK